MSITFAIPFYKNRDFLERAIRSVITQTSPNWSLVISDDAGPEGDLGPWIKTFAHPEKIHYIRQPKNLGIAGNWNACIALATSDLVTLLHADDELEPDYAATMLAAASRHPRASVFFCAATIIDVAGRPKFSFPDWFKRWLVPQRGGEFAVEGEAGLRAIMKGNFIMCPTMCYRRGELRETPFDARWRQVLDLDFIARQLLAGRTLVALPEIAYRYRRHDENQTQLQSDTLLRFEEERALFEEIAARAEAHAWPHAARTARRMTIIKLNLAFCVVQHLLRLQPSQAWKKMCYLGSVMFG